MTKPQQLAERGLLEAQAEWLRAYDWVLDKRTARWSHPQAPKARPDYLCADAMAMTRAETLRYGGVR